VRPVGPDDRIHTPRQSSVGDGSKPSADVRILKDKPGQILPQLSPDSEKSSKAMLPHPKSSSVPHVSGYKPSSVPQASGYKPSSVPTGSSSVPMGHATELAASLGLPADRSGFLALAAMLGECLALTQQTALSIRRLVKLHHDDPATARIAARALAAGLDPGSDVVGRVIDSIGDSYRDPLDSDGDSSGRDERKQESGEGFHGEADSDDETQSIRTLSDRFKDLAMGAGMNDDCASLAAPVPNGDGWVCIPFKVPHHGVDFTGIMRIWYDVGAIRSGRLVADIRSDGERRILDVREEANGRVLRYHADDMNECKVFAESFSSFGVVMTGDLASSDLEELQQSLRVDRDA